MADARIFICYRRGDSEAIADRLARALRAHPTTDSVFYDRDLSSGAIVTEDIIRRVSAAAVVLVIIGREWETTRDEHGHLRLADERDLLRREVAAALRTDTRIVPLLVGGARMPSEATLEKLAPELVRLADRNAFTLATDWGWADDIERLVLDIGEPSPPPPTSFERLIARARRWRYAIAAALLVLAGLIVVVILLGGPAPADPPLRIYSSLPERDPDGRPNKRTADIELAIGLALDQADRKAGRFEVRYTALDDSDAGGMSPPDVVMANAERAAHDEHTAVYIGEFNSGATQQSIPILSAAGVPQISPASTRVGLTMPDNRGDMNEPGRYYRNGVRNFVRIIPRDTVQARALLAVLQAKPCRRVAIIDDGSPYGLGLASNVQATNGNRRSSRLAIVFRETVGPLGNYAYLVRRAALQHVDCFVYAGDARNSNTIAIFTAFATMLPGAILYGTDGVGEAAFYQGLRGDVAKQVRIMVPPRDRIGWESFVAGFTSSGSNKDHHVPDPYAIYGYEAMQLALDAIRRAGSPGLNEIRTALFATVRPDSALGPYSISSSGDTTLGGYGISRIVGHRLTFPRTAPALRR